MAENSRYSITRCPNCGGNLISIDGDLRCEYCGNVVRRNAQYEVRKAYEQLSFFKKLKINISLLADDLWASFSFHLIRNIIITLLIVVPLLFLIFWA